VRLVLQRVTRASVSVDGQVVASIGRGLLALVGFRAEDGPEASEWMARKLPELRLFEDEAGKLNLSVTDIGGELLLAPNFTLYGDGHKGRRPSFARAKAFAEAEASFDQFVRLVQTRHPATQAGVFGAHMYVMLENDGPVTLLLDSEGRF
jgi:D-tyrosyl-tRNA(Tyr) deacylase